MGQILFGNAKVRARRRYTFIDDMTSPEEKCFLKSFCISDFSGCSLSLKNTYFELFILKIYKYRPITRGSNYYCSNNKTSCNQSQNNQNHLMDIHVMELNNFMKLFNLNERSSLKKGMTEAK